MDVCVDLVNGWSVIVPVSMDVALLSSWLVVELLDEDCESSSESDEELEVLELLERLLRGDVSELRVGGGGRGLSSLTAVGIELTASMTSWEETG